jgi:VIT1/CCC1 family predicted Fe2+/Mn2+ transporter
VLAVGIIKRNRQMNDHQEPKEKASQLVQTCSMLFALAGFAVYRTRASSLFGNPIERILGAAVVGGVCAMVGYGLGKLIEKIRG